jgi:hypothetical protein
MPALLGLAVSAAPAESLGQEPQQDLPMENTSRLRVFLDGDYHRIGNDFIRTEIDFVDWVRDQSDADVHIIVTSQQAGGGGNAYTIDFMGRRDFVEREDSLVHTSGQTDTDDEVRNGVVRTMKMGLAPYLARTAGAANFDITYRAARRRGVQQAVPEVDPWNFWVFRTSLGGNIDGEESRRTRSVNGSVSARRITEEWKLDFSVNGNYDEAIIELSSGESKNYTHTLGHSGLVAKSLGQHWAVGVRASVNSSTRLNQYLKVRVAPVLEFSFYPYSDFTRRQLTLQYSIGANSFDYEEETIYGVTSEKRWDQSLRMSLEVTQPWGDASFSVEAAHYFHDLERYHVSANTRCDIRLFRGFSFNVSGNYGRVYDQLYLAARGATDQEILLRLRRLQTAYDYNIRIGFSFTFGSMFNAIVNPRLQGQRGGGDFGGMMGRGRG